VRVREYEQAQDNKGSKIVLQGLRAICVLHCEIRKQVASTSKRMDAKASVAKIASYLCVALQK
jgi:hypothetical protein